MVCNRVNPFLQKEGIIVRYTSGEYIVMYVPDLVKLDTKGMEQLVDNLL